MTTEILIEQLLSYAVHVGLTDERDRDFARNLLLDLFGLDAPAPDGTVIPAYEKEMPVELLNALCDKAAEAGLIPENTVMQRELFDTRIMNALMPRPSQTADRFRQIYREQGAEAAGDWFYDLCRRSNYIRTAAVAKNIYFKAPSRYGELEITINLSKPEFTPAEITAMKNAPATSYPKCALCHENEGFRGRPGKAARQTLRCIPVTLNGEAWYFQYSPYVYYDEHCIVYAGEHSPMCISGATARRLFDFVDKMPHYFLGSNSDMTIVGGSILSHNHFQGGRHRFAMQNAPVRRDLGVTAHGTQVELIDWPLSTIRLSSSDREAVCLDAEKLITAWRGYSAPEIGILSQTTEKHNTVTLISDKRPDGVYELYVVLRNNRTTDEHPLGLFHPHAGLHHIKIEGIGLIEVMGLFVLPARLARELPQVERALTGETVPTDGEMAKHAAWMRELTERFGSSNSPERAHEIVKQALTEKCTAVLEDCGVFKPATENGRFAAFVTSTLF
ncbi:MAG: UDP-glucose--hexose-1-phosphate uridylyltransferase [Eubacteriales bacterium]|nr:UDP-glucose--hexose-1-phosphate uridylyltransferase [Eubacteriales bacterium]